MADIRSVGVIGAGQMGSGIAHVSALAGYDVLLNDVDGDRITAGISQIERNMARQVSRGLIDDAAMKAALARIRPASIEAVAGADIAIEAASSVKALDAAYKITRLQPVDMFPHTHHIENVALLELRMDTENDKS